MAADEHHPQSGDRGAVDAPPGLPAPPPLGSSALPAGTYDGKVVLVTGGGTGLGKAIAAEFARLGASVVVASRKPEHLAAAEEALGALGPVCTVSCDIRDAEQIAAAFDAATTHRGDAHLDLLDPVVREAARQLSATVGPLDRRMLADRNPLPAFAPRTVVQQVGGARLQRDQLRGATGMRVVGELFRRTAWSTKVRAALKEIAAIDSLQERRLLLCETLDCCSHRLDAWITAAAARRLSDLRTLGGQGAFIGAYGWLEDIALVPSQPAGQIDGRETLQAPGDGGYIHAPGMTHAVAAGILRSARLSHRSGDPNDDAMDIDVSSARMRDAASVLDGMRRGQSLGALLGYRLERRLHEASGQGMELDRFIYVLRTLAPLRAGKLTDPGQPAQESVAASDVVDGLRLMAVPVATVRQKLIAGPDDPRYITPPDQWQPPGPGEAEAVLAAIAALEQTHDAVADLLLAESVFQLASGNPARAAAALDVLGAGGQHGLQRFGVFLCMGQQQGVRHTYLVEQLAAARALRGEVDKRHGVQIVQGLISMGVPMGTARNSSSTSSLVTAMQPHVQSRRRCRRPTSSPPLGRPWILMAPPGGMPSCLARARSRASG